LYRVYSLFGDSRLPGKYRGDDSGIPDSLYMADVRHRFPTLTEATQHAILPFLTPPIYAGSWANPASSSVRPFQAPPSCTSTDPNWRWIDASTNYVRVWYQADRPDDLQVARVIVSTVDSTIWPRLSGLMGNHLPLSDLGQNCNGGSGRLDIYLTDDSFGDRPSALAVTVPYSDCKQTPVYILLRHSAGRSAIAHEIFHAMQFSLPLTQCLTHSDYDFWAEGSATWFEDFVDPASNAEHPYAPSFLNIPEEPLDLTGGLHQYGAYLLPFFVHRTTGSADFVRVAWEKAATQPVLEALDQTLSGGFEKVWPEFVKYNWNRDEVDHYKDWDSLAAAAPGRLREVNLQGSLSSLTMKVPVDLPRLSSAYHYFTFDDDSVSSVAFWNGVTTNLAVRDLFGVQGPQYAPDEATADEKKGAHVTALIQMGGSWKEEDWTNRQFVTFCRDLRAERIEKLVLIISNSEFKNRGRSLRAPGLYPILFASNMGCWQWKGTATFNANLAPSGTATGTAQVTWTRVDEPAPPLQLLYNAEGGLNWSITQPGCSVSGSSVIDIEDAHLTTYNFAPPENPRRGSYVGGGGAQITVCGAVGIFPWLFQPPQPVPAPFPFSRFLRVSADGKLMKDSFELGTAKWTWEFRAQRE
jgi:hypothetical protein